MYNRIFYFPALLFFVALAFSACTIIGSTVPLEKQIALQPDNSIQGFYKSAFLDVQYTYSVNNAELTISGNTRFKGMDAGSLDVRLLLLDSQGTIIQQKLVYSSGYRTTTGRRKNPSFETKLALPDGVTSISFTYSSQPRNGTRG